MMLVLLVLLCYFLRSQATVTSPPNGTVSACQGEVQTITCNVVTGSQVVYLAWEHNGTITFFSSGDTNPQEIPPFHFQLLSHVNNTLVSVATANVSTSLNGSTIECRNTIGITDSSIRRQITFNVLHSLPITYLHVDAVSSDTLLISWAGADCIQSYDVFINGTNVNTTSGMSLLYNTGGAIGSIDVLVNSVDYYGRAVGNLSTQYQSNKYNFDVEAIISKSMSLHVIIEGNYINQQPVPLSCELTVTNLTQSSMDCLSKRSFVFTNVTEGDVYSYTVTITNVIGSAVKNGSIVIPYAPLVVCPSEVQYSSSTMIMTSPISSVMESNTPTSASSDSNCVVPWTVGVLIGILAVMIIVLLVVTVVILIKIKTRVKIAHGISFNKGSEASNLSSSALQEESTESSTL